MTMMMQVVRMVMMVVMLVMMAVVKIRMNSRWLLAGTSCGSLANGHVCEGGDDNLGHNSCVLLAEFYILQGRPMHHPWNVFVLNFKHGL